MFDGTPAKAVLIEGERKEGVDNYWCYAGVESVRNNLLTIGYPPEKLHFVKGKVEDTLPAHLPGKIALLRLDTDWYESTRHELLHLYPLLADEGVLIIDDYGHWQGARKAVDEYFEGRGFRPFLSRLDYTGRLLIKTRA
jgi:O-methyltransferase